MNSFRTDTGGQINRARPITFTFDGKSYSGYEGDTLASALLANGVHLVGRSFKYHRPRGILGAGSEEPNALMRVGSSEERIIPNVRATQIEIYQGLKVESQNRFPSLRFDFGAINDILAPFFPAGFYYKTFMWPAWGWKHLYEPVIRRAAGLGRAPTAPDADTYAQTYAHTDVLIIGAGTAGLAAAASAAAAGATVIICDEQSELGGASLCAVEGSAHAQWRCATIAALRSNANVTLLPRTTAFGLFAQNFVALAERVTDHLTNSPPEKARERLWQVRAKAIILATGAIERPAIFPGNDRPGIMLASAAHTYLKRFGVRAGTNAVVTTNHDQTYEVALDLALAGIRIAAIADARATPPAALTARAREAGIAVHAGSTIRATTGRLRINSATLGGSDGGTHRIACDLLLMSAGFTPSVHLFSQANGALSFCEELGAYIPAAGPTGLFTAGACRGLIVTDDVMQDGEIAGILAARGPDTALPQHPIKRGQASPAAATPQYPGRAFVDFQNDVTTKDIALALREGFCSVEHVKRYTTNGMATDQGKTSNINALGQIAHLRNTDIPDIGLTTYRMPYTPVTFGTLAGAARGDLFDPLRETPFHHWAESCGAVFEDVALWKRARYFPHAGETMHQAVARECRAVRTTAGIFDASTLGKIEVMGPDAAIFLERMYVNPFAKLAPGRTRYGILLGEDGFIKDDGVIGRLSKDRFHVTTTTGGAPRVLAMMEDYLQTEWPDLDVWLTSTTEEWATIAIQGPKAREFIAPLIENIDMSNEAFPHMSIAEGRICNTALRLFRVSFTGELGFELNVPSGDAQSVWDTVWEAGKQHGITPYGTETMHVLRAEKGFIIVGQDTDGTVTPQDAGLAWAIGNKKPDFVGKRSLARAAMSDKSRKQFVGILTEDPSCVLEEGAQIIASPGARVSLGHITSAYHSANLGRSIALGMVAGGAERHGETLFVPMPKGNIKIHLVSPVFIDPEGARVHA